MNWKLFVINLDSNVVRWESIQQQFEMIGFQNYERFSAVNGKNIENTDDKHLVEDWILRNAKNRSVNIITNTIWGASDVICHTLSFGKSSPNPKWIISSSRKMMSHFHSISSKN